MTLLLRARGIQKCLYRICILMFSLDTCICLRMVEDREFSRKENNSILQYAAMFNKETIYSRNHHFILKNLVQVLAVSAKICMSYDFIIKRV